MLALRLLGRWIKTARSPDEDPDWYEATPLTRELVLTSLRNKSLLDAIIHHLSSRPPPLEFRPVLWIGLTQLLFLDGIADHAAVHETLEAAHKARFPKPLTGYANGLLRNVLRRRAELDTWIAAQPPHIRFSHPDLLFRRWRETFGPETAESICTWNQQRASTFARFRAGNLPECTGGLDIAPTDFTGFFQLPRGMLPSSLPGFADGHWYIQDPSTAIAPAMMRARPGERLLDACAAPGGKTALLADTLKNGGAGLLALDPNPARLQRLRENLNRLRLSGVEAHCATMQDLRSEPFDGILLDVPCSNTGVLQRRVDARWRFSRRTLNEVTALQNELLDQATRHLKAGGRLVYSTCSIEPEETTQQVRAWLQTHTGWRLEEEILRLPGEQFTDGAYAARLLRG